MKLAQIKASIRYAVIGERALGIRKTAALFLFVTNVDMALAGTTSAFIPSGVSAPLNGFVAEGSAINPSTGMPFRHLWISDHLQGLCRIDPDLDTATILPPGSAFLNLSTCTIGGPVAYDPQAQKVYIADDVANKLNKGLVRRNFVPSGDGGHGALGPQTSQLGDGTSCDLSIYRPSAMTQGPDGNLYIGFEHSGHITRVNEPNGDAVPCANFRRVGSGADGQRTRGLAWVNRTLYGLDGSSTWKIIDADQCLTPNKPHSCQATAIFNLPPRQAASLPSAIGSNQQGSTPNGTCLYISDIASVTRIEDPNGAARMTTNWVKSNAPSAGASMTDSAPVVIPDVFIAEDQSEGVSQVNGLVFNTSEEPKSKEPATPSNISATAGEGSAVVYWAPGSNGSAAVTGYTVYTFIPPDLVHEAGSQTTPATLPVPTSLTVTNLSNGTPYVFKVTATNEVGMSPVSVNSNTVTPKMAAQADAPQNLTVTASNAVAALAWQPPLSDGGSPINSYVVEYATENSSQTLTVPGNVTGTLITGLSNDRQYMAKVKAVNAIGPGLDSRPVFLTPTATPQSSDLALAMSGPTKVRVGSDAVYILQVTNTGGTPVPQVRVDNIVPTSGFGSATFSTNQGSCLPLLGRTLTCNLGQMASGQTSKITVTLTNVTSTISTNASVAIYQADGVTAMTDSMPGDNTQAITTSVEPPDKQSSPASIWVEPKTRKMNLPS